MSNEVKLTLEDAKTIAHCVRLHLNATHPNQRNIELSNAYVALGLSICAAIDSTKKPQGFVYTGPGFYKQRDGERAWVGCDLRDGGCKDDDCLVGADSRGNFWSWHQDGRSRCEDGESDHDLIGPWEEPAPEEKPEPKRIEMWVNVYPSGFGHCHTTRWSADFEAQDDRFACIHVVAEEGEGLS